VPPEEDKDQLNMDAYEYMQSNGVVFFGVTPYGGPSPDWVDRTGVTLPSSRVAEQGNRIKWLPNYDIELKKEETRDGKET